jgi:hypothetical protein
MIYLASACSINLSLCCCFFSYVCAYNSLLWCGNAPGCCSYSGVLNSRRRSARAVARTHLAHTPWFRAPWPRFVRFLAWRSLLPTHGGRSESATREEGQRRALGAEAMAAWRRWRSTTGTGGGRQRDRPGSETPRRSPPALSCLAAAELRPPSTDNSNLAAISHATVPPSPGSGSTAARRVACQPHAKPPLLRLPCSNC